MRRIFGSLVLILLPFAAMAFDIEDRLQLGPGNAAQSLRIVSTTDVSQFEPVLRAFLAQSPDLAVEYVVTSTTELMAAIAEEGAKFDVAISSAMDLQTKLANDRLTLTHISPATSGLPDWARWRNDVFAFTQEPAAFVLSRTAFDGLELPRTREALITLLRNNPDRFRGKVGTYDLRHSGLGYLFATQDSRTSEIYWRLTEVMGALGTRLYRSSSAMIDDVASGKLAVAYNVLGSYAASRQHDEPITVLFPADFTTVMMRTVLIPSTAVQTDQARRFVDFLLRLAWTDKGDLPALESLFVDLGQARDSIRRIPLGPGLLTFHDSYKKRRFLTAWENAILQE